MSDNGYYPSIFLNSSWVATKTSLRMVGFSVKNPTKDHSNSGPEHICYNSLHDSKINSVPFEVSIKTGMYYEA
jgi:hypothetical protein